MKNHSFKIGILTIVFFAINCAVITVNVYFPTEAVEMAAEKIIDEIEGVEVPQATQDKGSLQSFFWRNIPGFVFCNSTVYAEEINLNVTTPAIRKLIDNMKGRNPQIMPLKDGGVIGETYDGMLIVRNMGSLGGEQIRTAKRLLRAENADRERLYEELAKANEIPLTEIVKIKTVFAKTRQAKAKPGHWFQDEKEKWNQK